MSSDESYLEKKAGVNKEEAEYMIDRNPILSKKEFRDKMPSFLKPHMDYMGENLEIKRKRDQFSSLFYAGLSTWAYVDYGLAGFFGVFFVTHAIDYTLWYRDNWGRDA